MLAAAAFVLILCGAHDGSAQTPPPGVPPSQPPPTAPSLANLEFDDGKLTSFAGFFENDLLMHIGGNEDRNYTYGFALQVSGSFIRSAGLVAPLSALDRVTGMHRAHATSRRRYYTLLAFATGFTPDALNVTTPIRDDRPYASIVGASVRRLTVNARSFDRAWSSELAIGALGLDIVGDLQTRIHRWNRRRSGKETPYDPLGWRNQISHGGEPTALYKVSYERRLAGDESGPDVRKHWQVVGGGQGSVGYYTNAALLGSARLGWFTSEFWEFSPSAMNIATQNLGLGKRRKSRWELFLYSGLRPRVVAYNAMLQGQFRSSVHTVSPRRLVAEWEGGLAGFVPFIRTQLIWQFAQGRSPEFDRSARTHTWGSVVAVYSFPVKQP
jgi:hypothetical protein